MRGRRHIGAGLIVSLVACTSWRVQPLTPTEVITEQQPRHVRLTLIDRSKIELVRPQLRGDTLLGWRIGARTRDTTRVPVAAVSRIAVPKIDAAKTVFLVLGLGAVGFVIGALIQVQQDLSY